MKATKNTRAVAVGIFISLALIIFIIAVLTLGGQRKTFDDTIGVKAVFDDVNGLQSGSNVWFAGVKVGTVSSIGINGQSKVEVEMEIEEDARQYLRKNTMAKIGTDGLIGNRIVVLYGGSGSSPLAEGDQIAVEKAVGMDEMMNVLQENNKNLLDITTNFKAISQGLANGEGSIGKLLQDETLANDLNATLAILRKTTLQASVITDNVADYTAMLQRKGSLTNDLVTDTILFSKLRSSVAQIEDLSRSAGAIVENLKVTSNTLQDNLNNPATPVGMLLNDQETAASIRATIKNLQAGTEKLDENMEALQHNFLLRGFFKKKAKAAAASK